MEAINVDLPSDDRSFLNLNESKLIPSSFDFDNYTVKLRYRFPEENIQKISNSSYVDSKIYFEKEGIRIPDPEKDESYKLNITLLIYSKSKNYSRYVYGEIKVVDYDEIRYELLKTNINDDLISIEKKLETQTFIKLETLHIKLHAPLLQP